MGLDHENREGNDMRHRGSCEFCGGRSVIHTIWPCTRELGQVCELHELLAEQMWAELVVVFKVHGTTQEVEYAA